MSIRTHHVNQARDALTPSRIHEKRASRNGPRHSVYWVQPKKDTDMRLPTHANVMDAANMGDVGKKVEYTLMGKYTGDWKDGLKHGYGVMLYANGNKYEGEWVEGKRDGKGIYWVAKKKKLCKQYAGEWKNDRRHGLGTCFQEDGGRYEGYWISNKREGDGRMVYPDQSMYDGQWMKNERTGQGVLVLSNGDRYDGYWLNDKKEGPGRYYYKATRKMYEGEWVDGIPKCGTYHDNYDEMVDESTGDRYTTFCLPEVRRFDRMLGKWVWTDVDLFALVFEQLDLARPEQVVSESVAFIRQERVLEKAFHGHHKDEMGNDDDEDSESAIDSEQEESVKETSVVFDESTLRVIQREFNAIEEIQHQQLQKPGCIRCSALPRLVAVLDIAIDVDEIFAFLQEIGATDDTLISFAECVDILSLLAEAQMHRQEVDEDDHDDDEAEDD